LESRTEAYPGSDSEAPLKRFMSVSSVTSSRRIFVVYSRFCTLALIKSVVMVPERSSVGRSNAGALPFHPPCFDKEVEPPFPDDGVPVLLLGVLFLEEATLLEIAASLTLQFQDGGGVPVAVLGDRSAIPERQSRPELQFHGVAVNPRELGRLAQIDVEDLEQLFEEAGLARS
jgi:hypothetical protein